MTSYHDYKQTIFIISFNSSEKTIKGSSHIHVTKNFLTTLTTPRPPKTEKFQKYCTKIIMMGSLLFNKFVWIFLATTIITSTYSQETVVIEVGDMGNVRGIEGQTVVLKRPFWQFLGIPYGQPPVNESRFLAPEPTVAPLTPNNGTFDATSKMDCCPQLGLNIMCWRQSENCLGMHIYTPDANVTAKLPVVVFLHGGAFSLGSGDSYTGARLLDRGDVVIVSPNYRLGVLGFFCLNTDDVPGNAAMYDLHLALTWVKNYISYFGGNPDDVTIAGQSAGSVAVTHLMLSPLTRNQGLFHRAIALSGTALNEWGTTTSEVAKRESLKIAELAGCYAFGDSDEKVAACMRTVPHKVLVDTLELYQRAERSQGRLGFSPVTPVIQVAGGGAKFLDRAPEEILENGEQSNIPLIMGSTRHDGSFVLGVVFNQFLRIQDLQNNATFLRTKMLPTLLQALGIEDKTEAVYDSLGHLYLGDEVKESGNFTMMIPGLMDLHSVFFFKAAEYRTLKLHSRLQTNSYWYTFDFKGTKTVFAEMVNVTGNPVPGGVTHGDDLIYLFDIPLKFLSEPDELAVSQRMLDYWINFISSGNPGNNWLTFSEEVPHYIVVDAEDEIVDDFPNKNWQGLATELMPELYSTTTEEPTTPSSGFSLDKSFVWTGLTIIVILQFFLI